MALTDIIVHRVDRPTPTAQAEIKLRDDNWSIDGRVEECFRELKQCVLKKSTKDYGRFSEDRANFPVGAWLDEYIEEKINFTSFSKKCMGHLKIAIESIEMPFGAFIIFAREHLEGADLVHIFVAEHGAGQYIDGALDLADSLYLDTAGVKLAAKINLTDLKCDEAHRAANAISLLKWRGEKDLSDAFEAFVGFTDKVDVSAETEVFLDLVSSYAKELPNEIAEQTKTHVVDYCLEQDKIGKPVVIEELSTQITPSETELASTSSPGDYQAKAFAKFVAENQPEVKPEIIPDANKLRNYVRISGRNEQLSMSFASACLGETIIYDQDSDSITIKNIPSSLKSKLLKHMQKLA